MGIQCVSGIVACFTGYGAPAQGGSATASGASSVSFTFQSANTGGNTLIAFAGIFGTTPSGSSSITDTAGNVWTLINDSRATEPVNQQVEVAMWYATGCKPGANTVTVHNASGLDFDLQCWEYPASLSALDSWGGGDNSFTEDTDTQSFFDSTGSEQGFTTNSNDTVIIGAYNAYGSTLQWTLGTPSNPQITTAWTLRNQSVNPQGETSALFDNQIPAGVNFWPTVTIPPPVISQAVRIANVGPYDPLNHPEVSYRHEANSQGVHAYYPAMCGPFDYLDPSTNTFSLYAVLINYFPNTGSVLNTADMFKSTDQGATWSKVGTSPIVSGQGGPENTPIAERLGDEIYVLWYYSVSPPASGMGLFVSTFDMPSDSWTGTTTAAPGTDGTVSGGWANIVTYDFCVLAAGDFLVFYNTGLDATTGQTSIMITRCTSGTWQAATLVASDSIIGGLTFDASALTAYLIFEDFYGKTGTGPLNLYLSAITSFTWPFTPPSSVTLATGLPVVSGYRRTPACGPGASFRGQLYVPYMRAVYSGGTPSVDYQVPACFVGTPAAGFTSVDLTPNTSQGFTVADGASSSASLYSDIWAVVVGHNLYVAWCQGEIPWRVRYCVTSDGTFPAPVSTYFDSALSMPALLQSRINTGGSSPAYQYYQAIYGLSINPLSSGIGVIVNLGDTEQSGYDEAWYLLPSAAPPTACPIGNRFY